MNNSEFSQIKTPANSTSYRMYWIFYSGQIMSLLGSSVVTFAITWWITTTMGEEQSALFLSLNMFLSSIPAALLSPIIGVYIDRWDKKKVIAITDSVQAGVTFTLMILFASGNMQASILLITSIIGGFNHIMHFTAIRTLIPSMVPPKKLLRMNGINFLFNSIIGILNPILAAVLMGMMSIIGILWIDIITFGIAITLLLIIKIPKIEKKSDIQREKKSFFEDFKEGIKILKQIEGLASLIFLSLTVTFLLTPMVVLNTNFIYYVHSGTEDDLAWLSSIAGIGILLGSVLTILKKEWKHKVLISFGGLILIFIGVGIKALAPAGVFWMIAIGSGMTYFLMPLFKVLIGTNMQKVVPLDKQGRIFSLQVGFSTLISPVGYLIAGPIANIIGIRTLFLACAILGFISVILNLLLGNLSIYRIETKNTKSQTISQK